MLKLISVKGNYIYGLSEIRVHSEEYGSTRMYGIMIKGENRLACIKDISNSFGYVHDLFEMIVDEELCPEHLGDVVEDFLSYRCAKIIPIQKVREKICPC